MRRGDSKPELGNADINRSSAESTAPPENVDVPQSPRDAEEVPQLINDHERPSPRANVLNGGFQRSTSGLYRVSASFSRRGSLWPQTFEQQMEIYGSSPRRKYSGEVCEADGHGSDIADSDAKDAVLLHPEWKDPLKEPLLRSSSLKVNVADEKSRVLLGHEHGCVVDEAVTPGGDEHEGIVREGSTFLQASLNGTNVLAGVGILSTPYALSNGGWLSLSFLVLFAAICLYTGILLRKCLDTHPSIVTYPDIGQAAFGRKGRFLVSILLYLELYCVTVEFLIMEGDNLAKIFPIVDLAIGDSIITAHQFYVILSALCFMPTVWLRDLSLLSYISAGGVVACLAIVSVVGYVGAFEGVGFSHGGTLINFNGLPVAVGISAFCFCGHAVFPNIYGSMKHKEQFSKVLFVCFTAVTLLYGGIAVLGYTMFGDDLQSQVTLNLPRTLVSSRVAIWIVLVNPFAKFAVTITPLAVALEEFLPWNPKSKEFMLGAVCIRSLLVVSTVIVALSIPFFGLMMAFIGSFLSITVAVILPCLCYMRIYGASGGISSTELSLLFAVVFIGIVAGLIGTYSAIRSIIENITDNI